MNYGVYGAPVEPLLDRQALPSVKSTRQRPVYSRQTKVAVRSFPPLPALCRESALGKEIFKFFLLNFFAERPDARLSAKIFSFFLLNFFAKSPGIRLSAKIFFLFFT
jgi:hypothetical protein